MSLHAQLSPEARAKLQAQRRNSTISSIAIAILSVVLLGLILAFIFIAPLLQVTPVIVSYQSSNANDTKLEQKKLTNKVQRKPSAPASNPTNVIAALTTAPTAIPVPETPVDQFAEEFGAGVGIGDDWAGGGFDGDGGGGGGAFGSRSGPGLVGTFYDLKQNSKGQPTKMAIQPFEQGGNFDVGAPVNGVYDENLKTAIRRDLSESAFDEFFRAPTQLRLTQFCVPRLLAEEAPKSFDISEVKGRRWVVSYHGTVTPAESGRFRFVGFADDVLVVLINDRVVLDGSLASPMGAERRNSIQQQDTIGGWPSYVGNWVTVRAGQKVDMKILIGERPGGHFSGYLLLEKNDAEYQTDAKGSPILPLFKLLPGPMPERGGGVPPLAPDTSWSVWSLAS